MADEIKPKEGKEFWEFVRKTAEEVSNWAESVSSNRLLL